eukprot:CAMPEP_0180683464 /NCGR_PEP_ID=MMETSP1037_2-20121125/71178_1 /TAXON_ID=632150 /ORGANISM="Azadinium spinosum, Strain 3D9" /LENGTH=32 /DNA_ID= /DNA_START= /DNA_END= /DNA_ORIENTATION=
MNSITAAIMATCINHSAVNGQASIVLRGAWHA